MQSPQHPKYVLVLEVHVSEPLSRRNMSELCTAPSESNPTLQLHESVL